MAQVFFICWMILSCHQTNSIKSLNKAPSTDSNQWPLAWSYLFSACHWTHSGTVEAWSLQPLCRLFDAYSSIVAFISEYYCLDLMCNQYVFYERHCKNSTDVFLLLFADEIAKRYTNNCICCYFKVIFMF